MAGLKTALVLALGISGAALLSGCDNGPSAVAKHGGGDQVASAADTPNSGSSYRDRAAADDSAPRVDHRKDPVKLVDGKPIWAASRRYSAQESAEHAYARNGAAFGAHSLDDYVRQARAFVEHPPKGVETLTRQNGDTLYYDEANNIFAVADKDGSPRTMFKPDDGAAYWRQQKDRIAHPQTASRSHRSDDAA